MEIGKLGSILQRMQKITDGELEQAEVEALYQEVAETGRLDSYIHSVGETEQILSAFEAKMASVNERQCEAWLAPLVGELMGAAAQLKKGITEHAVEKLGNRVVSSQRSKEA